MADETLLDSIIRKTRLNKLHWDQHSEDRLRTYLEHTAVNRADHLQVTVQRTQGSTQTEYRITVGTMTYNGPKAQRFGRYLFADDILGGDQQAPSKEDSHTSPPTTALSHGIIIE